jgi:hypothetical protein
LTIYNVQLIGLFNDLAMRFVQKLSNDN